MPIALPPLRERHGDIPLLASYYVDLFNREFKRHVRGVSQEGMQMLESYQWPGNIREMRNAIERAMLLVEHEWLQPSDFTTLTRSVTPAEFKLPADGISLDEVERQLLVQALERLAAIRRRRVSSSGSIATRCATVSRSSGLATK
jgi:DNA-binding NtrC family response regulator